MKRKNFLAVMVILVMVLSGCGNNNTEEETTDTSTNTVSSSVEQKEETLESSGSVEQKETVAEPETVDINSLIIEKTDEELDLKQFLYSYEDRTMDKENKLVFDTDLFNDNFEIFVTTDKLSIYNVSGIRVGYVIKNIELDILGEYNGWYYFYLDGNKRFARAEDVEANSKTESQVIAEEEAKEEALRKKDEEKNNSNTVQQPSASTEPDKVEVPTVEETPVQTSDKYTPDEAIAVYRSIMEEGGMTWDPSIKDVTSWGTGWIYLDKGQPEWCASTNLESCAMGDSGGRSWTKYYLEVTGSDENAVYITEWTSN